MDKKACPECKGRGSWREERHVQLCGTFEDDEEGAQFHNLNCSERDVVCRVCNGSGELDAIQRAVYMARGGAAPVQLRGYA